MILSYDIAVDLTPEFNRQLSPKFSVSLGDHGAREYTAKILQGGEPYEIEEGSTVSIVGKKSDGHIFAYACTYADEYVYFTIEEQMTPVSGIVTCELSIIDASGNKVGSANFTYWVEPSPVTDGEASESDLQLFQQAVDAAGDVQRILDTFGGPNVAQKAEDMINTSKVYVYIGDETGYIYGHWYYYDTATSTWADGGIYQSDGVNTDTTLTASGVPADAKATGDALAGKQDTLTFDSTPTEGSTNPVTSGGVWEATQTDKTLAVEDRAADAKVAGVAINELKNSIPSKKSLNVCDKTQFITGSINANGAVDTTATTRRVSDYIPCKSGDIVYYTLKNSSGSFIGITAVSMLVIAFYDGSKAFISGSRSTSANSVTVPDGAEYLRFAVAAAHIEDPAMPSITFNWYPKNLSEMEKYGDILIPVASRINVNPLIIDCWGDSRTESGTSASTSYTDYLQTLLGSGYIVANYGVASQASGMCAARLGSNEVFVTLNGGKIPSSGDVGLTDIVCSSGNNRNLYAANQNAYIPCNINGVQGRLSRSSISDYTKTKFLRDSDGIEIVVRPKTKIVVDDVGSRHHACILWWGKNDFTSGGTYIVNGVLDNYKNAVEYLGHNKYVILGETCSLESAYEPEGTARTKLDEINKTLLGMYPDNYIDINAWLSSEAALESVGLTATAQDLEYISKGWPCYQLMRYSADTTDTTHMNEYGRQAIAKKIHEWMRSKGWI